jgi:hypothetical protein
MSEENAVLSLIDKSRIMKKLKALSTNKNYLNQALRYCERIKDEYHLTNDELVILVQDAWDIKN